MRTLQLTLPSLLANDLQPLHDIVYACPTVVVPTKDVRAVHIAQCRISDLQLAQLRQIMQQEGVEVDETEIADRQLLQLLHRNVQLRDVIPILCGNNNATERMIDDR